MKKEYFLKKEENIVNVKGIEIKYMEDIAYDKETEEEIYVREVEIENDIKLYDIYKKEVGLMTSTEIKLLREKYSLTQKELALILGLGEVSINRFEKGKIQTKSVNTVLEFAKDPTNLLNSLIENGSFLNKERYEEIYKKLEELINLKRHKIAYFDKLEIESLEFKTISVQKIAKKIIEKYNLRVQEVNDKYKQSVPYITQLTLQKLIYYVQGLTSYIFEDKAFEEEIEAWNYGPVVREIYTDYSDNKSFPIETKEIVKIPYGLDKVVEIVVNSYGLYNPYKLIDLTHEEDPWKTTKINEVINFSKIKDYFNRLYAV